MAAEDWRIPACHSEGWDDNVREIVALLSETCKVVPCPKFGSSTDYELRRTNTRQSSGFQGSGWCRLVILLS